MSSWCGRKTGEEGFLTEVILSNIRVLAIDQRIEQDAEGNRTAVGTTATLELNPEQTKIITVAQQMADRLTPPPIALRSVADVQESDIDGAKYLLSGEDGSCSHPADPLRHHNQSWRHQLKRRMNVRHIAKIAPVVHCRYLRWQAPP